MFWVTHALACGLRLFSSRALRRLHLSVPESSGLPVPRDPKDLGGREPFAFHLCILFQHPAQKKSRLSALEQQNLCPHGLHSVIWYLSFRATLTNDNDFLFEPAFVTAAFHKRCRHAILAHIYHHKNKAKSFTQIKGYPEIRPCVQGGRCKRERGVKVCAGMLSIQEIASNFWLFMFSYPCLASAVTLVSCKRPGCKSVVVLLLTLGANLSCSVY